MSKRDVNVTNMYYHQLRFLKSKVPTQFQKSRNKFVRQISSSSVLFKKKTAAKIQTVSTATYDVVTFPGDKKDVTIPLPKTYSPKFTEACWNDWWEKEGFFKPTATDDKFVMCLPPPNVTGKLHIGHAFTGAIQDAIVRWNRMKGLSTLWIPGLDHAGIATQVVVEKQLWRDDRCTRHDVGRSAFTKLIWKWKHQKAEEIVRQMKKMGLSLDWSRNVFTMDKKMSDAVNEAFIQLYDDGLIYRDKRMVNWCCNLLSTIADIEVDNIPVDGPKEFPVPGYTRNVTLGYLTSFAYPILDKDEEITVATTRLETMLGDTAIAVHPEDERYKHLIGSYAKHPFCDRLLPVVGDEFVEPALGTGAVKLTPAHSLIDHEIAQRHRLSYVDILDDTGCIINSSEKFNGLKRFDAREQVAQQLQKKDLWRGQTAHHMKVPICSRSGDIIEPRLKEQWFLNCSDMAEQAIQAVHKGDLKFTPNYYRKLWSHFLTQTKNTPWCISRQLWWGHQIPAYKVQSTEGKETADLSAFYPGHMIESGSDILFFWLARMIMLGQKLTGKLPFNEAVIHSLLLSQGKKMSKSKGNVIDPMSIIDGSTLAELEKTLFESNISSGEMNHALNEQKRQFRDGIPECGADTLRMALCSYPYKGSAINIDVATFIKTRSFCNKVWQTYKFFSQYFHEDFKASNISQLQLSVLDKWMLDRTANLVHQCDDHFKTRDLSDIVSAVKHFWQYELSSIYLECIKPCLQSGTSEEKQAALSVAVECLGVGLRCLSPFMPFLSEELYQRLPSLHKSVSICTAKFPAPEEWMPYTSPELTQQFDNALEISHSINHFKSCFGMNHRSKRVGRVYIHHIRKSGQVSVLNHLTNLCKLEELLVNQVPLEEDKFCVKELSSGWTLYIDLSEHIGGVDTEKILYKVQALIKAQSKLLEETHRTDLSVMTESAKQRHQVKVESIKQEMEITEMCANYLLKLS